MSIALGIILVLGALTFVFGLVTKNIKLVAFSIGILMMTEIFRTLVDLGL